MKPPHLTSTERGTYYDSWGTPDYILDLVRECIGDIDMDLASSEEHNKRVKARYIYTAETSAFTPDFMVDPTLSNYCNPPGPGKSVLRFWDLFRRAPMRAGAFLFFNVDHMRNAPPPERLALVCLLRKRQRFVGAKSGASFPSALVVVPENYAEAWRVLREHGNVFRWVARAANDDTASVANDDTERDESEGVA